MFRLWAKIFKDNRLLQDTVICDGSGDTRTHKVFRALEDVCYRFDLGKPIWLDANINDFRRHSKTRFRQDSFVEQVDFDFLEIPQNESYQAVSLMDGAKVNTSLVPYKATEVSVGDYGVKILKITW